MPSRRKHWDEYDVCVEWQAKVGDAALPFEARWTEAALRRIDPALHARFLTQREKFNAALENGTIDEVVEQGAAMVRGYVAVVAAMEAAGAPDDAYQIGRGPAGLTIGIGPKPCCPGCRNYMATPYSGSRRMRSRPSSKWTRGSRRLSKSNGRSLERR